VGGGAQRPCLLVIEPENMDVRCAAKPHYTVKKNSRFPVASRDVTNPGR
jgi:hypothetical protein